MLTIKVVNGQSGNEQISEALQVEYIGYKVPTSTSEPLTKEQVMFMKEDKNWETITEGMIYVMNRDGKTIAKYDLLPPPPPQDFPKN